VPALAFSVLTAALWKILCGRTAAEAINAAVSYLTIAAGTGRSNLVSQWSANAVETYTGLHSSRAKAAISALLAEGYLSRSSSSSRTRPVYELEPFANVLKAARAKLTNENGNKGNAYNSCSAVKTGAFRPEICYRDGSKWHSVAKRRTLPCRASDD
jgi:hypothetical protein